MCNEMQKGKQNSNPVVEEKQQTTRKKQQTKRWTWNDDKVEMLITNIISYKNDMTFKGLDFQADLVSFYEGVRVMMAEMFPVYDFGPKQIEGEDTDLMSYEEIIQYKRKIEKLEKLKKDGYNRVKAKIKELRIGYKDAIDKGTPSGSGRLVHNNYRLLQESWGGSPSVTSLECGYSSNSTPLQSELEAVSRDNNESLDDAENTGEKKNFL